MPSNVENVRCDEQQKGLQEQRRDSPSNSAQITQEYGSSGQNAQLKYVI